jgi:hypothetical protein
MEWRRGRIKEGGRNVRIIAVWLKGLSNVYDAYDIASCLEYSTEHTRGQSTSGVLENHRNELLVQGCISSSSNRVLACFEGDTLDKEILSFPLLSNDWRWPFEVTIPQGSLPGVSETAATNLLMNNIHSLTGVSDGFKFCILVLKMCGRVFTCNRKPDGIVKVEISRIAPNNESEIGTSDRDQFAIETRRCTIDFVLRE